ncbi:hypothetical protein ABW20_dc0100807 [Dactylellina cionopaga]|nr:hypothetical protein ABW20_dc0100807 [Dactylellina cionopaga]
MNQFKESLVAFMGLTGSGKSTLINLLLGENKAKVGHELGSETSEVASYRLNIQGIDIVLVDTPGFDDTTRSDIEVLRALYDWLKSTYNDGSKLNAIFYLHNITDTRMRGSTVRNLYAFKKLCGDDFFSSVLLGTNFWRNVGTLAKSGAEMREAELMATDMFWRRMIDGGAMYTRIPDDQESALDILMHMARKAPRALQVQLDAAKEGSTLENSAAHTILNEQLAKKRERHQREIEDIAREARQAQAAAAAQADKDRAKRQQEHEAEKRELKKIHDIHIEAERRHREELAVAERERELLAKCERKLEERMRKLKIAIEREQKMKVWDEKIKDQMMKLQVWEVNMNLIRNPVLTYMRICDICMENIGYGDYWPVNHNLVQSNSGTDIFSWSVCSRINKRATPWNWGSKPLQAPPSTSKYAKLGKMK